MALEKDSHLGASDHFADGPPDSMSAHGPAGRLLRPVGPRERLLLGLLLLGALAVRVALALGAPHTMGDTASYLACARVIPHSGVCPQPADYPFLRAPGYPWFLAALGASASPLVYLAQAVLDTLTALLVWVLARRLFGVRIALLSLSLYAVYPFALSFASTLGTETLYTFLVVLSFVALTPHASRHPTAAVLGGGLATGLAILVRPGHEAVAALLAVWLLIFAPPGQRVRRTLVFVAGVLVLTLPQVIVTERAHPGLRQVANGAWFNVWLGNGPMAPGLYAGSAKEYASFEHEIWEDSVPRISRSMEALPLAERERLWRARTLGWMEAHPGAWMEVKLHALVHTVQPWVDPRAYSRGVVAASVLATLLTLYGGLAEIVLSLKRPAATPGEAETALSLKGPWGIPPETAILFLIPVVAVLFMNLVFQPHIRFRAALADPLLLPWGVAFYWRLITGWRRRGGRQAAEGGASSAA